MYMRFIQKSIVAFSFVAAVVSSAFCQYQEGIDTTDANGYAKDSLFVIKNYYMVLESGSIIVDYYYHGYSGFFNNAFEDIQKTPDISDIPDTVSTAKPWIYLFMNCSYAIQKGNNQYVKICFLQKLSDGRYVYRYGRNNINQLAPQSDSLLKPNNVHIIDTSSHDCIHITWEPPLTKVKQLKGYIYYISKQKYSVIIDTLKPINMAQWDSVAFTSTTSLCTNKGPNCYINLVAVYKDGSRSEFLKGWTYIDFWVSEVVAPSVSPHINSGYSHLVTLRKTSNGYRIDLGGLPYSNLPESIAFYSLSGCQIGRIDGIKGGQPLLPIPCAQGVYFFKMVFRDNHVISGRCMIAR